MHQALPKADFCTKIRGHTTLSIKHENQTQQAQTMQEFKPYTPRSTNQAHTPNLGQENYKWTYVLTTQLNH